MVEAGRSKPLRTVFLWVASLVGAAVFLALASTRLRLWPETVELPGPWLLAAAAALHIPYGLIRALRLQYVFDPLVASATPASQGSRLDRRVLYGSGFVSFFVLLVLPLKLGELSRPVLLSRGHQRGLGITEAVGGVALERLVDGLIIVAMLFGGLAASHPTLETGLADVQTVGIAMLSVFVVGLAGLLLAAQAPERAANWAGAVGGMFGASMRRFATQTTDRVATTMKGVLALERAAPFLLWSVIYWAVTAAQLWLVLASCGIQLAPGAAAAIVAIVGLSIQLPGGPAQAGTFQVGASLALSLYLSEAELAGAGSTFAAVMYILQFAGAGALALPGLWLLARARREVASPVLPAPSREPGATEIDPPSSDRP